MIIFYLIAGGVAVGVSFVIFTVLKDKEEQVENSVQAISPEQITSYDMKKLTDEPLPLEENSYEDSAEQPKEKKSILGFLKLNKKMEGLDIPEPTPLPSLKEVLEIEKIAKAREKNFDSKSQGGTASLKTGILTPVDAPTPVPQPPIIATLSSDEQKSLEKEIDTSIELGDLKEKYIRLDKLFKEKSAEYDKIKNDLENELKHRKEFNKVKDILEKEISEAKTKTRQVHTELTQARTESDAHKKRITQLEDRISTLEKDIIQKETQTADLTKKLNATPSMVQLQTVTEISKEIPGELPVVQESKKELPVEEPIAVPTIEIPTISTAAPIESIEAPVETNTTALIIEEPPHEETETQAKQEFLKLRPDILTNLEPQPEKPNTT